MYSGKQHQKTSEECDTLGKIRKVATAGKDGCVFVLNVAASRSDYMFSPGSGLDMARPHFIAVFIKKY